MQVAVVGSDPCSSQCSLPAWRETGAAGVYRFEIEISRAPYHSLNRFRQLGFIDYTGVLAKRHSRHQHSAAVPQRTLRRCHAINGEMR